MIPRAMITEWANKVPWEDMHNVEQDLIIGRALTAIFSDDVLSANLAFRGGTALHKLYLPPPSRYSEDIDLVQIEAEPIGFVFDRIKEVLSFLGAVKTRTKMSNNVLLFRFETTFPPVVTKRLKIEINCKEHFTVMGQVKVPSVKEYALNLKLKINDPEFRNDIAPIISPNVSYDIDKAYEKVMDEIVAVMQRLL
jgi:hypothetical protein